MPLTDPKPIRLLIPTTPGRKGRPFRINETPVTPQEQVSGKWRAAEMAAHGTDAEAWEQAYEVSRAGKAAYVEPDLETGFQAPALPPGSRFAGAAGPDQGVANPQDPHLEIGPGFAWHLRDDYTGLATARQRVNQGTPGPVRIAIMDVGFDLTHRATAPNVNLTLARNFTGDGPPTDVSDDGSGKNPGHGTGTLSILASDALPATMLPPAAAGMTLGGVPEAEIVPLKIAHGVVLLRTSAFATALDYLTGLNRAGVHPIDVLSMSMGGVASRVWADAVNAAYEAGITMVTAAGNTKIIPLKIVYPARFQRVIAACGAMANHRPYKDVPISYLFGCWGPDEKMPTALAAFTPNIPWAEWHSPEILDLDGQGTSSATPQVAAAAALWIRHYKNQLAGQPGWKVVEAVRHALFSSADRGFPEFRKYYGNGILQAHLALEVAPDFTRPRTPADTVFLPISDILFGAAPEREMAGTELAQLAQRDPAVDGALDSGDQQSIRTAIIESQLASPTLKRLAHQGYRAGGGATKPAPQQPASAASVSPLLLEPPVPEWRRLQAFAYDPLLSTRLDSYEFNRTRLEVPWERLEPGPAGEYLEVIDVDPPSDCVYQPVDLNHPHLLASDGLSPSIGNPQFHQQMAYAVSMRTIHRFELGLGRRVMWSPAMQPGSKRDDGFIQRLRLHPHALFEENAYYDPGKKALLFGYFNNRANTAAGGIHEGGMTFTCLSHDIIAHETTHAILDGIYREYGAQTNADQRAFHEGFADLVAMFQHFLVRDALVAQLRRNLDLSKTSPLLELAQEFGRARGMHGALRSAIGRKPSPDDYRQATKIHDRGAVLVAAVFAAFVEIYQRRTADLLRIATQGTGILPKGEAHPDLVNRLAETAATIAGNFLDICIRALDYCPPADLTFGDYLRALVTADHDLVPDDPHGYRVALIDAFRQRGIYPPSLRALSEDTLLWHRPTPEFQRLVRSHFGPVKEVLAGFAKRIVELDPGPGAHSVPAANARAEVFKQTRLTRSILHGALQAAGERLGAGEKECFARELGLEVRNGEIPFQVHTLFLAERTGPNGRSLRQFVVSLLQSHPKEDGLELSSGCTLLIDRSSYEIRHAVRKGASNQTRLAANLAYAREARAAQSTYFAVDGSYNFAALHAGLEEETYGG